MSATLAAPMAADPVTVTEAEAARLTALSGKTLHRLHQRGEPVGRLHVGRAVRYHRATLIRWAESQATVTVIGEAVAGAR